MRSALRELPPPPPLPVDSERPPPGRRVWWLAPHWLLLLTVVPSAVAALLAPSRWYNELWRTPKYVDAAAVVYVAAAVAALLAGLVAGQRLIARHPSSPLDRTDATTHGVLVRSARVLLALTIVGYVAYILAAARSGIGPADIVAVLQGLNNFDEPLKDRLGNIPGLTTLTQCGAAFIVVEAVLSTRCGDRRFTKYAVALLVVCAARALLMSERLALIEVVLPFVLTRVLTGRRRSARRERVVALAPVLAVPALLVGFGAMEYARSWVWYSQNSDFTFVEFVGARLTGYYATSYNNGEMRRQFDHYPQRLPFESVELFWQFPAVEALLPYDEVTDGPTKPESFDVLLERHANPEFNSPGGYLSPIIDLGLPGGLAFLAVVGTLIGAAHAASRANAVLGLLLYPICCVALLEWPRYQYLSQGRALPMLLCLLVVGIRVNEQAARHRRRVRVMPARGTTAAPARKTVVPPAPALLPSPVAVGAVAQGSAR